MKALFKILSARLWEIVGQPDQQWISLPGRHRRTSLVLQLHSTPGHQHRPRTPGRSDSRTSGRSDFRTSGRLDLRIPRLWTQSDIRRCHIFHSSPIDPRLKLGTRRIYTTRYLSWHIRSDEESGGCATRASCRRTPLPVRVYFGFGSNRSKLLRINMHQ